MCWNCEAIASCCMRGEKRLLSCAAPICLYYLKVFLTIVMCESKLVDYELHSHQVTFFDMSSFSPKDVAHLCKFNGTNYPFWKFQVSIVLRQFELMDIVTGKEKNPAQTSSGHDSVIASNAARIKTWKQKDYAAISCLITTLEESIQRSIIACKSANEIWERLEIQFEQTASQNKYYLQQRFYGYSYQ
jgi:hypothetical protein